MNETRELRPEQLCRRCDPDQLRFETTAELPDLQEIIGQSRALEAIRFGIGIGNTGYNIYALGPAGLGKHSVTTQLLTEHSRYQPSPPDWCYVYNFDDPQRPGALELPPGMGRILRDDMAQLIDDLRAAIPSLFESEEYRSRAQEINEEFKERQDEAFAAIQVQAREHNTDLIRTPSGFALAPTRNGEVLSSEEFEALPEEEQKRLSAAVEEFQARLKEVLRQVPQWRKEVREKLKALNREMAITAAGHQVDALRGKYAEQAKVLAYLKAVEEDIISHIDDFRQQEEAAPTLFAMPDGQSPSFRRYVVNVVVDRSSSTGVPIHYEDNPSHQNLVGRLEYVAMLGALVTDFSMIRAGALHRANGGYLLLDAHKLLSQPFAWEGLKRALRSRELRFESVERLLSLVSTSTLEPEPIPLNVKVVLLGDRLLYYLLCEYDPDFADLFKVAADFEEELGRDSQSETLYAQLIATIARKHQLRPFQRDAVARLIEHAGRLSGDTEKLTTHLRSIADVLCESAHFAAAAETVSAAHVQQAIDAQIRRASRVQERLLESIRRGTTLITTQGEAVGQINGLSVVGLGGYSFGVPHRITARVRLGEGELIDIEREVELGGPIHSKGVLILAGFLGSRYAADLPLSLAATLVFEQSYSEVEGDSASSAELYALLSALAQTPLKQSLAVTGSVNQQGEVQAIGAVNEKIEGFFAVCVLRGLTGEQGVLVPAANVPHLMLRRDVVEAVEQGLFHIYPVTHIDQGLSLLTGLVAGETDAQGNFPEATFNGRVRARLHDFADLRQFFVAPGRGAELP